MSDFRKGDVCSLEVTVLNENPIREGSFRVKLPGGATEFFVASYLTLIRRAPVDLATCEIPPEGVPVVVGGPADSLKGRMVHRHENKASLVWENGAYGVALLSKLTPLDAPAPAPDQSEQRDMGAEVVRLREAAQNARGFLDTPISRRRHAEDEMYAAVVESLREALASTAPACAEKGGTGLQAAIRFVEKRRDDYVQEYGMTDPETGTVEFPGTGDEYVGELEEIIEGLQALKPGPACAELPSETERLIQLLRLVRPVLSEVADTYYMQKLVDEALVGRNPTCPPGHIMIGNTAVPEPMREAPEYGTTYWLVGIRDEHLCCTRCLWQGTDRDTRWLARGLIHATEAAARTHAEAIVAASKREG